MFLKEYRFSQLFLDFYFDDFNAEGFSRQLYKSSDDIEAIIGADNYFELIDCDLSTIDGIKKTKKIIKKLYADKEAILFVDRAIDVCEKMLSSKISVEKGCKALIFSELKKEEIIPIVFTGYSSEFDDGISVDFYRDRVIADTKKLLEKLQNQGVTS